MGRTSRRRSRRSRRSTRRRSRDTISSSSGSSSRRPSRRSRRRRSRRSGHSRRRTRQPARFGALRSEDEYPSICVCFESSTDHCNWWKNCCCPCLGSKEIALHVGESDSCAWGWCTCLGICCPMATGNCAHGAVVTQKLRKMHGFEENLAFGVISHWCCQSCSLTQEQHLIENDPVYPKLVRKLFGPARQTMRPGRMMM